MKAFSFSMFHLSLSHSQRLLEMSQSDLRSTFSSFVSISFLCQVTCLSRSVIHCLVASLPHTPFTSLVSRTLATRTVMSSMRSWILQLWPRLPAHEALLKQALGTLSSMQPSSLAHTNACHYRPFLPQTLASRYTDRRTSSLRSSPPPSHALTPLCTIHMVPFPASLFGLGRLLTSLLLLCITFD